MGIRMTNIATPMPQLRAKFTSKLGIPLSGCKVYTYEPSSDIPKTTWIDINKTVENTNPIQLDAAGEADIYLDGLYRIVVEDRFGFVIQDVEKTGLEGDEVQQEINKRVVFSVYDYYGLGALDVVDGQAVLVKKEGVSGEFVYLPNSTKTPDGGTVVLDSQGRKWERTDLSNPKIRWWGAVGDNVANDDIAYLSAIAFHVSSGFLVDGEGLTYKTNSRGSILTALKNATINATSGTIIFDRLGNSQQINAGRDWEKGMTEYSLTRMNGGASLASGFQRGMIAMGQGAFQKVETASIGGIAIGPNTLSQMTDETAAPHNIAIGDSALTQTYSDGTTYAGSRNIAIGSLAGHFNTTGYMNTFIGRDAGHNNTFGNKNTLIGYSAGLGGQSPIGWTGGIELQFGGKGYSNNTAIGESCMRRGGEESTAIGSNSVVNIKSARGNVAIGYLSGQSLDRNLSYANTLANYDLNVSATYNISGSNAVFTLSSMPSVGIAVGDTVGFSVSTGSLLTEQGKAVVTAVSGNNVTIALPVVGATGAGNAVLRVVERLTTSGTQARSDDNVLIGRSAAANRISVVESIVIGTDAMLAEGVGSSSGNVVIGTRAARDRDQLTNCTAVGLNAMRFETGGSTTTASFQNSTCLGSDSRVGGDHQVQLGNSLTTTYVYGTVQNRSDARDKAEIRDTELGLDFINSLRPVDYKWDMRDDYIQVDEDGNVTKLDKDGSKKRTRYHHGFIAQEVPEGFGGYQDHKVQGGADVLSLGYDEFIAPLVKAVQELTQRVEYLESNRS